MTSVGLSKVDLFGTRPYINLNGSKKSYSLVGLAFTVFVGISFIWFSIYLGSDVFNHRNPKLVNSNLRDPPNTVLTLPKDQKIAFGIQNSKTQEFYPGEDIYTVEAFLLVTAKHGNTPEDTEIPIALKFCDPSITTDIFGKPGKLWCFDMDQSPVKELQVSSFENVYPFVRLKPCRNGTATVCKTQAEIEQRLAESYFAVFYDSISIDPSNFKTPVYGEWRIDWFTIAPKLSKVVDLYYQTNEFTSHNGILFEDIKTERFLSVDQVTNDLGDFEINDDAFLVFELSTNGRRSMYERKYPDLASALSSVGGLINVLILAINLVFSHSLGSKCMKE